jgi:hypothetical protein
MSVLDKLAETELYGDMCEPSSDDGPPEAIETLRERVLTRADLPNLPRPEPLIEDTLDMRTLALLAGYHGTGKSFIALDWACCVATGHRWQGRDVRKGKVLYVASEGAEGLHGRVSGWEYAWREHVVDLDILPFSVQLGDISQRNALAQFAAERRYLLVILDTLARCAVGLDENSAKDMGLLVEGADRVRRQAHATVLVVHHTGKDKTTVRGSSALEAGVDTVYTTEGDTRYLKLDRTKRKEGPTADLHTLMIKANESGSCHVQAAGSDLDLMGRGQRLLSTFMSTYKVTGATKAELRRAADMPNATFSRALNDLITAGTLTNTGTEKRPFYHLGSKQ